MSVPCQQPHAFYLRRTLDSVEDPTALAHYSREVAGTVQTLFRGGLGAVQIGQIVSSLNDALVKRLVSLAEQALGPPPTDFAWIVFGSEGRLEQTLLTDQDNALIYEDASEAAHTYFKVLGKQVVDGLIQVGFPPCAGGYMATKWCKPRNNGTVSLLVGYARLSRRRCSRPRSFSTFARWRVHFLWRRWKISWLLRKQKSSSSRTWRKKH